MLGLILAIVIALIVNALIIYIVGRLGLGLTVDSFVGAIVAAAVIAIVSWLVYWVLGLLGLGISGGFWGAIISLIIAAVVLLISDRFVPGMAVKGFVGAIVAAIAIAIVAWIIYALLGAIGIEVMTSM
jgi:putative membrane protein